MKVVAGMVLGVAIAFGATMLWFMFNPLTNTERAVACNLPKPEIFVRDDGKQFMTVYSYENGGIKAETYEASFFSFKLVYKRHFLENGETVEYLVPAEEPLFSGPSTEI